MASKKKDKQEGMDIELQRNVCYEFGVLHNLVKRIMPEVFEALFGDTFTDEELGVIYKLGSESCNFAEDAKVVEGILSKEVFHG